MMKERGTYLDPTYSIMGESEVPAVRIRAKAMLPRLRETVQRAHKMGVTVVAGTDTTYGATNLTRIGQELSHLVQMGFTPLAAIQAATIRNAEMLRLEKSIGLLETGYEGDLIAIEKNPLEDMTTIQDPLLVISNGRVGVDRPDFGRGTGTGIPRP